MAMLFLEGWEKQTERWDMSLTSLPEMRKTQYHVQTFRAQRHTPRSFHSDYPGLDVYLDYSIVSSVPQRFSKMYVKLCWFPRLQLSLHGCPFAQMKSVIVLLTICRYGQRLFRVYVPHLVWWARRVKKSFHDLEGFAELCGLARLWPWQRASLSARR